MEEIGQLKQNAAHQKQWDLWGPLDHIDALLHRLVTDLIVEGRLP